MSVNGITLTASSFDRILNQQWLDDLVSTHNDIVYSAYISHPIVTCGIFMNAEHQLLLSNFVGEKQSCSSGGKQFLDNYSDTLIIIIIIMHACREGEGQTFT